MKYKVIVRGINAYGFKFEIHATMAEAFYNVNLKNYRSCIMADVKSFNNKGETISRTMKFKTEGNGIPLNETLLYWQSVEFEDGSVLENENAQELDDAALITRLTYEFKHKTKFKDEYNQYVGCPVYTENSNNFSQGGLILSVNPINSVTDVAHIALSSDAVSFTHLNKASTIHVYKDDGEDLFKADEFPAAPPEPEKKTKSRFELECEALDSEPTNE